MLSLFDIPAPLWLRALVFLIIASCLAYQIFAKKKVQKFDKNNYFDFFAVALILVLSLSVVGIRSGFVNVNFETTDPAVHFLSAERFSESNKLIEFSDGDLYYGGFNKGVEKSLFFAYTSMGTLFQIAHGFDLGKTTDICIFNLFESFILFCSGVLLYLLIASLIKESSKIKRFICFMLVGIFLCGYPLNNFIFGFHYLGLLVLNVIVLIDILLQYKNLKNRSFLWIFALTMFTVFSTYYMFVPVIYGSIGLYYGYSWCIKKEYSFKEIARIGLFTLIVPFLIGCFYYFIYNMIFHAGVDSGGGISAFKLEGYIYRNLLGNFVILLPVCIYGIFKNVKNKEVGILDFMIICEVVFMALIFIFFYKGVFASYYFYKNYYLLWMLLYLKFGFMLFNTVKESRISANITFISLLVLLMIAGFNIETKLTDKNILLNPTSFTPGLMDIFNFNKTKMKNIENIYTRAEIKDLMDIYDNSMGENVYYYENNLLRRIWAYDFVGRGYDQENPTLSSFYEETMDYKNILKDAYVKQIVIKKSDTIFEDTKTLKMIYENGSFVLYEKIK